MIGAGASKHAGVPLLGEFRGSLSQPDLVKSLPESEPELLSIADQLFDEYQCGDENVETLFSAISAGASLGSTRAIRDRDTLAKAIAIVVEASTIAKATGPYQRLAESISKLLAVRPRATSVIVVSFNWDAALDIAFRESTPEDGVMAILGSWLPDRVRASYQPSDVGEKVQCAVEVRSLRPHGCISWGVCPTCSRTRVFSVGEIGTRSFYDAIVNEPCGWHTGEDTPKLEPCIIAPTWDKTTHTPDLQGIWTATAQALTFCENLLVIGFSLPPSDANVQSMFRFALGRNSRHVHNGRLRRAMVIDPCCETQDRWRSLLTDTHSDLELRHVLAPFEKSVEEIGAWLNG